MYSTQPNGAEGATINPATINPAAINPDLLNQSTLGQPPNLGQAQRGIKRSRSPPDPYRSSHDLAGSPGEDDGDPTKPRKRGRPMKAIPSRTDGIPDIANTPSLPPTNMPQSIVPPPRTPQSQNTPLPGQPGSQTPAYTPAQTSPPPKTTPTKTTVKALPTVRDHTTDQLGPGGDEYLPRETDESGEKKVQLNGQLQQGREYRCRTFLVPNRGDKLFMLATECARVLGYRDSYLLFNKNRSLFKIIANQVEKDDLVQQEILPFSYRSRQIAIVTARSMFRQFGSRVITNGRRVRDDYWEAKARKQGFTEADLAGEKRPGAAKAREAAAEANNATPSFVGGPQGEIVYQPSPAFGGAPQPPSFQQDVNDTRTRDSAYSHFIKSGPRQEINGPAYTDRTQPSTMADIHHNAHTAAEYNRSVNQQRDMRNDFIQGIWRKPHEQPASTQPMGPSESNLPTTRPGGQASSPHAGNATMPSASLVGHTSPQMMMTAAPYTQGLQSHQQQPLNQTPMRGMPQPSPQQQSRTPTIQPSTSMPPNSAPYTYTSTNQMWGQPHTPQAAPQHYSGYTTQGHQPAHTQQRHPSAGHNQMQHNMQYSGMQGMSPGYGNPNQGMYPPEQTPRQFMNQNQTPAVTQPWSNPQAQATGNWWSNQHQ